MKRELINISASILAKLNNVAREQNVDYNYLLLRYCQERFLYRLSVSKYSSNFCLKGGLFLVCIGAPGTRATRDIDFLAKQISNDKEELENIIASIADLKVEDGVSFSTQEITSEEIVDAGDYHGIRIRIEALIGNAKIPLQLDFAWDDVIMPKETILEFPTILNDQESPKLTAYSIESVISEKFEAAVDIGIINSRMKDFYDIYTLSLSHDFDAASLAGAIDITFSRRGANLSKDMLLFKLEFANDPARHQQWNAFLRKHKLDAPTFPDVMSRISSFLQPIALSIVNDTDLFSTWNPIDRIWQ